MIRSSHWTYDNARFIADFGRSFFSERHKTRSAALLQLFCSSFARFFGEMWLGVGESVNLTDCFAPPVGGHLRLSHRTEPDHEATGSAKQRSNS